MSDPTVEKVREALNRLDRTVENWDRDEAIADVRIAVAAARLCVDAGQPDIEAAIDGVLSYWLTGASRDTWLADWWTTDDAAETAAELVKVVIAAAFSDNNLIRRADR